MKRRITIVLVALAMLLSSTACGNTTGGNNSAVDQKVTGGNADVEQKMTFALHNAYDIIDPGITNNTFASPILMNVFEGLVTYDKGNNIVEGSAESWKISDDGLVYTFTLRDGMKWSNGDPLTANDFAYSYLRVLDPKTGSKYAGMLTSYIKNADEFFNGKATEDQVGIKALNETTLEITLKNSTPYFLGILGMSVYSPVHKATVTANPDKWTLDAKTYISNGPFKISQIKFGEAVVLVKNENYWGAKNVKLEELTFRYIPDSSTSLIAFEKGEIDGQMQVPTADLPRLKAESEELQVVPSYATTFYDFNCKKAPYDNVKVRRALAMAIDRKELIENVLQSTDLPAFALVAPGYSVNGVDFAKDRSQFGLTETADITGAQALLAEAGYPGGKGFPVLKLSYYTDPSVKKIVEAMQQMWQKNLGITVEVSTAEWSVYYKNIQAFDFDIGAMGWGGDYFHPMTFLPLFKTGDENNNLGYSNAEYDKLVKQAQIENDPVKAMKIMQDAEKIGMEEMPIIPLYYRANMIMMSSEVKDWNLTPLNNLYFKDVYKVKTAK